jgi:hypothetical protein
LSQIARYQISFLGSHDFVIKSLEAMKVEQHTDKVKLKELGLKPVRVNKHKDISVKTLKIMLAFLKEKTWKELEDQGFFSRAQIYRAKKVFTDMGLPPEISYELDIKAHYDFNNYETFYLNNFDKLKKIFSFDFRTKL